MLSLTCLFFFFFNDTATTEIYTLSLHDALPISHGQPRSVRTTNRGSPPAIGRDRKSTRLNSSHLGISYAVFCLKKKKKQQRPPPQPTQHPTPRLATTHTTRNVH